MKAAGSSRVLVPLYHTMGIIPEDSNLHILHCENLKYHKEKNLIWKVCQRLKNMEVRGLSNKLFQKLKQMITMLMMDFNWKL
jgi:hypothetical protein